MREGEIVKKHLINYPIRVYSGKDLKEFEKMKLELASKEDMYMLTKDLLVLTELIESLIIL